MSLLATAALVVLIPTAAAASGGHAPKSVANTTGAPVTVTVSIAGTGGGWVTSNPAGISCGSTCSAELPDGTLISFYETPAVGSSFVDWSASPALPYGESCPLWVPLPAPFGLVVECSITVNGNYGDASVQATFNLNGPSHPPCVVPNVVGRTLAGAETRITNHNCGVGTVKHAHSRRVRKGRVISQSPPAGWQNENGVNAMVNLVVSKGRH